MPSLEWNVGEFLVTLGFIFVAIGLFRLVQAKKRTPNDAAKPSWSYAIVGFIFLAVGCLVIWIS